MDGYKPQTVVWDVRQYRRIVDDGLSPHRMLEEDFNELMTQILHVMLNEAYAEVMFLIGPSFPQCYRMKDNCYEERAMASDMIQVTSTLVEYATYEFKHLGLLGPDGTLPYCIKRVHNTIFVLDHIPN